MTDNNTSIHRAVGNTNRVGDRHEREESEEALPLQFSFKIERMGL